MECSNILHPLMKLTPRWLECQDQPLLNRSAQPVLVNDNIYAEGRSNKLPVIWNYSISRNSWSPLPYPEGCLSDRVTITAYQSRLVVIAAQYQISDYGKKMDKLGNKVFTLSSDGSWEEDVISPLPHDLFLLNMFACSEGDKLIVAWKTTKYRVKLLLYDGHTWNLRDGPDRTFHKDSNIIICEGTVFLTNCEEYPIFHKIYLEELQIESSPKWIDIQNIPRDHSNLISLCGHLTLVFKLTSRSVCAVAYLSTSDTWIELGDLNCEFGRVPNIVCVSETRLLLIGQTQTKVANPMAEYVPVQFPEYLLTPQQIVEEKFGALVVEMEGNVLI